MKTIYLDYAAATPLDKHVLAAMQPYFTDKFYNPSATYLAAKSVKADIEAARASVASILGVTASEIIFTAGGTEANNLAINGIMRQFPDGNIIVSSIEHESVLEPAMQYPCKQVPVNAMGMADPDALEKLIDDNTVLVSVMYANNEIGTIQPLSRIVKLIRAIRHQRLLKGSRTPLYFHSDACQAANYLNLRNLGIDLMTLNGGKMYGPKQSGALYCSSMLNLKPQILGGGQERRLRSGTENIAQIMGFSKALEMAQSVRLTEVKRLKELKIYASENFIKKIPGAVINGTAHRLLGPDASHKDSMNAVLGAYQLPNNLHVTFPGYDNERLMMQLDEAGILCAVGSACSASNENPSHVLKAIGLSDAEARSSLRFSMGRQTTKPDVTNLIKVLAKIVA